MAVTGEMTDKKFREFIQRQPSCISGRYSEFLESGEGRSIAIHVRRASTFGTGYKAPYSAIPATFEEHATQHQHGEAECLRVHLGLNLTRDEAREWFDQQVLKYRRLWEESSPPRP